MHVLRRVGRTVKSTLRQSRARVLRSLGVLKNDWSSALPEEISFWEKALTDPLHCWLPEEFRKRTDPDLELQNELKELIDAPPDSVVRILDVGAGPLTTLGKRWQGRTLEIVAIDPLANTYQTVLQRVGIRPLVETVYGEGERLLEIFHENQFDLAYASNALDHTYDPLLAINQMFAVVKPSRFVYLWHFANEGLNAEYSGLHQWNFDVKSNDFVIDDGRRKFSLGAQFRNRGRLECHEVTAFRRRVVIAKLQKLVSP